MKLNEQLQKIQELYSANLKEKGVSPKSVGWKTEGCQRMRFSKLANVLSEGEKGYTVNDYGCGYGAMLRFLTEELQHPVIAYNGYDISSEMLESAEQYLESFQGKLNLLKSDKIQTEADYSFVSGTFNVRFDAGHEAWEKFIREKLDEIHQFSRRGFAFNMLTTHVDYEEPHLYYAKPSYWFDYCKKNFSKEVSLLHDYPLWEWTIIVRAVD